MNITHGTNPNPQANPENRGRGDPHFRQIPRIEDLPYWTSPPVQFVYESRAFLAGGIYTWADAPTALTPVRPIRENVIYYFREVSLAADISELDFTGAIITTPQLFMFKESDARHVLFREPLIMNQFFKSMPYRFSWETNQVNDQLFAAFRGVLNQTPALVGKASIVLKVDVFAQEIVDDNFNNSFKTRYPKTAMPEAIED